MKEKRMLLPVGELEIYTISYKGKRNFPFQVIFFFGKVMKNYVDHESQSME